MAFFKALDSLQLCITISKWLKRIRGLQKWCAHSETFIKHVPYDVLHVETGTGEGLEAPAAASPVGWHKHTHQRRKAGTGMSREGPARDPGMLDTRAVLGEAGLGHGQPWPFHCHPGHGLCVQKLKAAAVPLRLLCVALLELSWSPGGSVAVLCQQIRQWGKGKHKTASPFVRREQGPRCPDVHGRWVLCIVVYSQSLDV